MGNLLMVWNEKLESELITMARRLKSTVWHKYGVHGGAFSGTCLARPARACERSLSQRMTTCTNPLRHPSTYNQKALSSLILIHKDEAGLTNCNEDHTHSGLE